MEVELLLLEQLEKLLTQDTVGYSVYNAMVEPGPLPHYPKAHLDYLTRTLRHGGDPNKGPNKHTTAYHLHVSQTPCNCSSGDGSSGSILDR